MDVDLQLFKNIMKESRNNSDLLDSYSPNQFKSKEVLINHINGLNILNDKSEIIILGSWYGSILIPAFKQVKRITAVDLDENVISIAKNRLFNHYKNVDFICDDVFKWIPDSRRTKKTDLIINTSCEHMRPMRELDLNTNAYFAFQSNNMFDIPTHINCVNNIDEFKEQLPVNAKIMIEDHITDDRGTRFLLIGQL
jgi:hypothetical protein